MDHTQWERIKIRLREEFGEAVFRSWMKPLALIEVRDGVLRVGAPTRFMRDWVNTHYAEYIRALTISEGWPIA
ncbi:MAG: hypothetical protein K2Q10_01425, partial [Rhodospirillales bacterium]|nr:hypothetical protein [Rhodospirillales bacterium]